MIFTYDEINLMCIYDISSRKGLIAELKEIRPYIDDDEILEIADSAISKLESLSDEEFGELELIGDFEEEEN